jgi:hypothetical protein
LDARGTCRTPRRHRARPGEAPRAGHVHDRLYDRSAIHNFHLASNDDPTVDFRTDVPFVGDMTFVATFKPGLRYATWDVELVRGSYTYRSGLARSKHRLRLG